MKPYFEINHAAGVLMLVATMAAEWGFYRSPAGKAVYFVLAFQPYRGPGGVPAPREGQLGGQTRGL